MGPLIENLIDHLGRKNGNLRIIALSALIENQEALLKWFPGESLVYVTLKLHHSIN